jgi:small multidrug resistance family-3 protein
MRTLFVFSLAALAEILGCFAFWAWLRLERSAWFGLAGVCFLILFAVLLTLVESPAAGRVFAAYGGLYIVASLGWLQAVEGVQPDRWDLMGGALCLAGAALIIGAPRAGG